MFRYYRKPQFIKRLSLAAVFIFMSAVSSFACLCAGESTVAQSFKGASAVFVGKFIREEYRSGIKNELHEVGMEAWGKKGESYEVLVHIFQVDRWWKGAGTYEVVLITDHTRNKDGSESISDCGLGFEPGKEYLVYAHEDGDHISTNACSRTRNIKRAAGDIKRLNRLAKPRRTSV